MRKKGKAQKKTNTVFWSANTPGESITGKFLHWEKYNYPEKGDRPAHSAPVVVLDVKGEIKKVSCGTVLVQIFSDLYKKIRSGKMLTITFTGKNKRTKIYTVAYEGKEYVQQFRSKPVEGKELNGLFNLPF